MAPSRVESSLSIEDGALVWRLAGVRGKSTQNNARGRGASWGASARARTEDREFWKTLLVVAGNRNEAPVDEIWECPRPAQIVLRVFGGPLPDSSNVAEYHKYAIDALVAVGYLIDDSPKYVPRTIAESLTERPDWLPKGVGVEIRLERAA